MKAQTIAMAAASLTSYSCCPSVTAPRKPVRTSSSVRVRAQRFRDHEGRARGIVDANSMVLRERIEQVKLKERFDRCCRRELGWNYAPGYDYMFKKDKKLSQFFEVVGLVCGIVGFTWLSGTMFLCSLSLLLHFSQYTLLLTVFSLEHIY